MQNMMAVLISVITAYILHINGIRDSFHHCAGLALRQFDAS